jgi:hypothetical protein
MPPFPTPLHTTPLPQVHHLQQIKGLCPGAFDWRHVLVPNPVTKRPEQQLLLLLPDKADQAKAVAQLAAAVEEEVGGWGGGGGVGVDWVGRGKG